MYPKHAQRISKTLPNTCPKYVQINIKRNACAHIYIYIYSGGGGGGGGDDAAADDDDADVADDDDADDDEDDRYRRQI